jgi:probable F420-dependent oxidoreductase
VRFALGLYQRHPIDPAFAAPDFVGTLARTAENVGFDGLYFTEHPIPGDDWLASGGHDALDPFVGLAFAAAVTSSLRLLTNLTVVPYRNPFLLAKAVATLDRLSGGRLILGAGTGYLQDEYDAVGVDFEERNALFDESLAVCRLAWTGRSVTYRGLHLDAHGVTALPTPVQDPVPVWIGGNAARSLRRVAEQAQGWMPLLNPRAVAARRRSPPLETLDDLAEMLERLHGLRKEAGRADEPLDVLWVNLRGPDSPDWDPDAFAADLARQETLGVTWNAVNCSAPTPAEAIAFVESFGELVIGPHSSSR